MKAYVCFTRFLLFVAVFVPFAVDTLHWTFREHEKPLKQRLYDRVDWQHRVFNAWKSTQYSIVFLALLPVTSTSKAATLIKLWLRRMKTFTSCYSQAVMVAMATFIIAFFFTFSISKVERRCHCLAVLRNVLLDGLGYFLTNPYLMKRVSIGLVPMEHAI